MIINNDSAINQAILMEHGSLLHSNIINNKNPIGVVAGFECNPKIAGSLFWNNENAPQAGMNITYSALNDGYGEAVDMNIDLSLENMASNGPHFADPAPGDFHLLVTSPLIDKVNDFGVAWDFDGNDRPQGKLADIGMYELIKSLNLPTGDDPEQSLENLPTGDDINYVATISWVTVIMIISLGVFYAMRKRKFINEGV